MYFNKFISTDTVPVAFFLLPRYFHSLYAIKSFLRVKGNVSSIRENKRNILLQCFPRLVGSIEVYTTNGIQRPIFYTYYLYRLWSFRRIQTPILPNKNEEVAPKPVVLGVVGISDCVTSCPVRENVYYVSRLWSLTIWVSQPTLSIQNHIRLQSVQRHKLQLIIFYKF